MTDSMTGQSSPPPTSDMTCEEPKSREAGRVPQTLADLLAEVATWSHWSAQRRKAITSYIRTAALIVSTGVRRNAGRLDRSHRSSIAIGNVPCDVAWLNAHLYSVPPQAVGLSTASLRNITSGLRAALREVGLLDPAIIPKPHPQGEWGCLMTGLEQHEYCHLGLGRLAHWCESRNIPPSQVKTQTLALFETHTMTRTLHDDIPGLIRGIAKSWRKAATLVEDWPNGNLKGPARRTPYTLPFDSFPLSFQDDVQQFLARLADPGHQGPFRLDGPRRALRLSTVQIRQYCLRQSVSALALLGRDPGTITRLADLVEEQAFRNILLFYWERAIMARVTNGTLHSLNEASPDAGVTTQTGAIGHTLMMVAKYHCKLPPEKLRKLAELAADLQPSRQSTITPKNLERLNQFEDPARRRRLLHCPEHMMRRAETLLDRHPRRAAEIAKKAVALEILLHIPLRIGNLAQLRLGDHLKYDGGRSPRIVRLVLQRHETKNDHHVEWSVSPGLAAFLDRYLQRFHPLLTKTPSPWLFPGRGGNKAMSIDGLRYHITRTVADEVGAVVNPHLFRALAARLILEDSPDALEDVRLLLGDKTMSTVLAHYCSMAPASAAERYDNVLRRARGQTSRREPKAGGARK